jgi:hypothetical protein
MSKQCSRGTGTANGAVPGPLCKQKSALCIWIQNGLHKMGSKHERTAALRPQPDAAPMEMPKTAGDVRDALANTPVQVCSGRFATKLRGRSFPFDYRARNKIKETIDAEDTNNHSQSSRR